MSSRLAWLLHTLSPRLDIASISPRYNNLANNRTSVLLTHNFFSYSDEHFLAHLQLLDIRIHGRVAQQMVQLPPLLPLGSRRLSPSSPRRLGRRRRLYPPGIRHSRRLPHPRPGTLGLQVRSARLAPPAQGHHLAIAQHDVLQSSNNYLTSVFECNFFRFLSFFFISNLAPLTNNILSSIETVPVHQLRRTLVASSRGQGADAQPPPGTNHLLVPKERQEGNKSVLSL